MTQPACEYLPFCTAALHITEVAHVQKRFGEITVDNRTGAARRVDGVTVGEVCCFVTGEDRITSTLSHHLRELRLAGLVDVERRGN